MPQGARMRPIGYLPLVEPSERFRQLTVRQNLASWPRRKAGARWPSAWSAWPVIE